MSSSQIERLKELAVRSPPVNGAASSEKFVSLGHAIELFSEETRRLESAYESLKEEFTGIHLELEETNRQLVKKVAELNVMSSYLQSLLSNISQGILFINLNGDITTYNQAAERLFGVESSKVLFSTFWQFFDDALFGYSVREALALRAVPPVSCVKVGDGSGRKVELEINSTFVCEDEKPRIGYLKEVNIGKIEGIVVIIRDVTDINLLREVANRNDRLKELGEMAAMVAHEVRNPLGGIKGFASLLCRDLKDRPEQMQMAQHIVEGAETLNRFVTNVLDYSRPFHLSLQPVDLLGLLKELKEHLDADDTDGPKVGYCIRSSLDRLEVIVDPQLINSALLNLLLNAKQAMPDGGQVMIEVSLHEEQVVLKIADTGVGIPAENLDKIFSPFFTTKKGGNGFGLTEVYKVIQAHGGDIQVESQVGIGTTFTIRLPIYSKKLKE